MKIHRASLVFLSSLWLTFSAGAQTAQYLLIQWGQKYNQTSDTTLENASSTPFQFRGSVQGSDSDPLAANTFTTGTLVRLPDGTTTYSLNYDSTNHEWNYESSGYSSYANLTAAFPTSGANAYSMDLAGTLANAGVTLPTTVIFPDASGVASSNVNAPLVTLTGGTWQSNGTFLVTDVSAAITISFNAIASVTPTTESYHYDVSVNGGGMINLTGGDTNGFVNADPTGGGPLYTFANGVPALTIAANQLVDGNTYTLEVNYAQIIASSGSELNSSAFAAVLYQLGTNITLVTPLAAVPEPSSYALMAGLGLMGFTFLRRRRA